MSSINKALIIGNVGNDPEIRSMQSGDKIANFSVATSEKWKDQSGERKERTQWHNIVVFNKGLVSLVESYVKKGSKIYIEGQIETRKWQDQSGHDKYSTEIVLRPFKSEITLLDSKKDDGYNQDTGNNQYNQAPPDDDLEDEIPF